jgi:anaerobic magnesium-protoporphyrin IX monomethyl ester cyclase
MAKKRVLMLTPKLRGSKEGINRIQPPLGPMIAASVMRENYGLDVKIHDCALEGWEKRVAHQDGRSVVIGQNDDDIYKVVADYKPDVVGVSVLFANLANSSRRLAEIVKDVMPNTAVVFGGNNVSNSVNDAIYGRQMLNSNKSTRFTGRVADLDYIDSKGRSVIDYVMHGEVDFAWPQVAAKLANGEDIDDMPGIVAIDSNNKYGSKINLRPAIPDMKDLPFPARDLVNMAGYHSINRMHNPHSEGGLVLPVMASRGCPEKCSFCSTPQTWTKKVRWREIDHIIAEIESGVEKYGIGEVQFEDDTLTARKNELFELCRGLEPLGLKLSTPNGTHAGYHQKRVNGMPVTGGVQLEIYQAMKAAGFYQVTVACESGDQRVHDELVGKGLKVETINVAIANAKAAGLYAHSFWTVGYPKMPTFGYAGESVEEIERTILAAKNSGADSASLAIVTPNPGTRVYREVVEHDLLWEGSSLDDTMFINSLTQVEGFDGPMDFEGYVKDSHKAVNYHLKTLRQKRLNADGPGSREDLYAVSEKHNT